MRGGVVSGMSLLLASTATTLSRGSATFGSSCATAWFVPFLKLEAADALHRAKEFAPDLRAHTKVAGAGALAQAREVHHASRVAWERVVTGWVEQPREAQLVIAACLDVCRYRHDDLPGEHVHESRITPDLPLHVGVCDTFVSCRSGSAIPPIEMPLNEPALQFVGADHLADDQVVRPFVAGTRRLASQGTGFLQDSFMRRAHPLQLVNRALDPPGRARQPRLLGDVGSHGERNTAESLHTLRERVHDALLLRVVFVEQEVQLIEAGAGRLPVRLLVQIA